MILKFEKNSEEPVSRNFKAYEFDCPCPECEETLIDTDLIDGLQAMRDIMRVPLVITSAYRCEHHQKLLRHNGYPTSEGRSTHEDGKAADLQAANLSGNKLAQLAEQCHFRAIGIAEMWIHVDTRSDKDRRWKYQPLR